MRLRFRAMLFLFLSDQGVHPCVYLYVNVRMRERGGGVLVCLCICTGVRWITCRDGRHHADLISVIAARQPGALGTSVEVFYILLSALNVCVFFFLYQYFETALSRRVYSPPNRLILHPFS